MIFARRKGKEFVHCKTGQDPVYMVEKDFGISSRSKILERAKNKNSILQSRRVLVWIDKPVTVR